MKRLMFLLLVLLTACTGTSEPPLDLLLAIGSGNSVVFYPAGVDDAAPVGSWGIGAEVVDLLRPSGEPSLWVLTPARLLVYPLSGGSLSAPPSQTSASASLELGVDCASGRLIVGEARALVDCRNGSVWTVPFAEPALEPVATNEDEAGTIYLLGPGDQLTRIRPTPGGLELVYPGSDPYPFAAGVESDRLAAAWAEEELLIAVDTGIETRLYTWNANSSRTPEPAGDPLDGLTGLATILSLTGGWLIGGDEGYVIRRTDKDDLSRPTPVYRGMTTPNFYAYLIAADDLLVIDLLDPLLQEHRRSLSADPSGLAWLPVGE